ncbi:MFS domain-containing protein [Fusarium keratoplasticum]|uniref:MFS domain-containing protein n=1 Tax=Fusarium keratoplasticum TaxID=1328300 RepID=A0ACC0R219_9HYPO|nr:MFS domain-containing protein [Fusarium keratoplasticum]KAI8671848.1 MFS domain-containing protein [Fusarium keratoplasticum]
MSTQTQAVLAHDSDESSSEELVPSTISDTTDDDLELDIGVTFTSSLINGLVIIGLPAITKDLQLPPPLAFWPASVSGLATASSLLLAGAVADVLGPRWVDLVGCFASGALMIGSGASGKGTELVAFRALQGSGWECILPRQSLSSLNFLSADVETIRQPGSIAMLCLSTIAFLAFVGWVHRQDEAKKPALIPNSIWKNATFFSICVTIALSFAVLNSMELFCSLFFQEIQHLPALQASIRILPCTLVAALVNIVVGLFVHKIPAIWIVTVTSILCAGSPLLMAVIDPSWPYWGNAFVAQILQPISCDALFTVGLIIITDVFPEDTQGLAGAVFNTAAQFGSALGLAILQVISTQVTKDSNSTDKVVALMQGYRASFWTMFGMMLLCTIVGLLGLRKAGRIGLKRD